MPFDFFGFTIKRKGVDEEKELISPVTPIDEDGATIVTTSGGFINTAYNLEFGTSDSKLLINKYRELSLQSDIESAIDEIINEAIVTGDGAESPVGIILDKLPFSEEVKEVISGEFENILNLLDFNANAYEIFKRWYVDGRIYFNIVIDAKNTKDGIQELRYMDPRDINKIKEVKDEYSKRGVKIQKPVKEYYVYNNVNIPADSVATSNSGLIDYRNKSVIISYLHKAIKPYNQLRMLEDATVIYRLARAPERRIFKVGTGGLPKIKAEQYVNGLMNKFRNKIVYDSVTGDLRDDAKTLSILEDYWIPVGDDGKSTDITTLPGGQNLGEMGDVEYFQKRLYRALHVPNTRLTAGSTFNTGRATEIDREEVKFTKFIKRLRNRFAVLFTDLLRKQLILKNIVTVDEWDAYIKNSIFYDFRKDSHFLEYNEAEIQSRRMELASTAIGLGDDYYSLDYIKKNFLKLSEEEIAEMKKDKEGIEEPEEPADELGDLDLGDETGMGAEIGLPGELPGQTQTTSTPATPAMVAPPTPQTTPAI